MNIEWLFIVESALSPQKLNYSITNLAPTLISYQINVRLRGKLRARVSKIFLVEFYHLTLSCTVELEYVEAVCQKERD